MNKLLTFLFALCCTTSIFAYDCKVDGIYYNLNAETMTATVTNETGDKNAKNYSNSVRIPSSIRYKKQTYRVTTIRKYAFSGCKRLTSITIPNSVTMIEDYAFHECSGLIETNYTGTIAEWCKIAFASDYANPIFYSHNLFIDNAKIENLVIPNSITTIGRDAFSRCSSLTSVTIPNSVTTIGYGAFYECTGLTSVTIPNSVTMIDDYAFMGCTRLKSITIPQSVTTIGESAFYNCKSLTSVTIGYSVRTIEKNAFFGCNGLTKTNYTGTIADWCKIKFNDYDSNPIRHSHNLFINNAKVENLVIPNSVTTIEKNAFRDCRSLTSVTIPNSVTTIGYGAFSGCDGLAKTNYTGTIADWCKIKFNDYDSNPIRHSHNLFINNAKVENLVIPNSVTTIEENAFYDCRSLTSVTIPNSVTTIGGDAFSRCSSLTSVIIGNSVRTIGYRAFSDCSSLISITFPNSIKEIKAWAFEGCSQLKNVAILSTSLIFGKEVFKGCSIDNLSCAKTVAINQEGATIKNVHYLSQDEMNLQLPYATYAQYYVQSRINQWQKKSDFEKTSDWQKRVNEATRKKQADVFLKEAKKNYEAAYAKRQNYQFSLGSYDADNEVYLIKESQMGNLLVPVALSDAQYIQQNWSSRTITPHYAFAGNNLVLQSIDFTFPNKKTYTYKSTQNLTYAQADIQYNFDPIDLNLGSNTSSTQPKGQQTIQQKQLTIGKSSVDTNIPTTGANNTKTFVVILANEDYESVASVPFAKNDGNTFKKYCINTLGIPEKNIHLRENATLNHMRSELGWLKQVCDAYKGEASVIFYYAGHGIPDENDKSAYLLPSDGDGRYVQSGYKLDDLYSRLGSMSAKSVTVFMDACFSGSQRGSGMLASARGVALKAKSGVPQGKMVVFSAAQGDETAYPNNEEGHGMFTYYLLKKLQETKGDVTLKDLGEYIKTNVSQQSIVLNNKSQTPCVTPASAVADSWQSWKLK